MPKEVKFDYSDAISTANADVNPDIHRPSINTYNMKMKKDQPKITGPYIRNEEEILSHDYTEMNKLLSSFLDNIVSSYNEKK